MNRFSFEGLKAYEEARALVRLTYDISGKFPAEERYGLTAQLRRAIISVPSNIAEGSGRVSLREKINFLGIAFASLMESFCQLQLACDLGYITEEEFDGLREYFITLSKLISGLKSSFAKKWPL